MRLEEWQKFIETQFLTDDEPVAPKAKQVIEPSEPPQEVRQHAVDATPTERISLTFETTVPQEGTSNAKTIEDTPTKGRASFALIREVDSEIPTFSDYMPTAKPEPKQLAFDVSEPLPELPKAETPTEPKPQIPRTRAKHVRNVRPEEVVSGLSTADLWTTVPKHVQTLIELGRMDDIEVAQNSYKRPFAEKRRDLIERLLDPILSLEDTAHILNVCPTTVRRYTNRGILTCYRKEPGSASARLDTEKETRQRRFRLSDILVFLEAQASSLEADRRREQEQERRRQVKADVL